MGAAAALQLAVDFCEADFNVSSIRPNSSSSLADCGDPDLLARLDFSDTSTGTRRSIGALEPSDLPDLVNNKGVNDPPIIITNEVIEIDVNEAVNLFFVVADPDVNENINGRLSVSIKPIDGDVVGTANNEVGIGLITKNGDEIVIGISASGKPEALNKINDGSYSILYVPKRNSTEFDLIRFEVSDNGYSIDGDKEPGEKTSQFEARVVFNKNEAFIWRSQNFPESSSDLGQQHIWGWTGDPDNDGISTIRELLQGRDPNSPDSGTTSEILVDTSEGFDNRCVLIRRGKVEGLEAWLESSNNLNQWTRWWKVYDIPLEEIIEETDDYQIVKLNLALLPFSEFKKAAFFRIAVVLPDDQI